MTIVWRICHCHRSSISSLKVSGPACSTCSAVEQGPQIIKRTGSAGWNKRWEPNEEGFAKTRRLSEICSGFPCRTFPTRHLFRTLPQTLCLSLRLPWKANLLTTYGVTNQFGDGSPKTALRHILAFCYTLACVLAFSFRLRVHRQEQH